MSAPLPRQPASPLIQGWRIEVPMPGCKIGHPVGWLSQNRPATSAREGIRHSKVRKAWRLASFNACQRVPTGLGRIHVTVELRFPDKIRRDPPNFEPTIKPVIDALSPMSHYVIQKGKRKGERVELVGRGVIPDDNPKFLARGETIIGEPLGRTNPIKGIVILHILPLSS